MQIAVISTINHNPGDDFIRYGQEYLIRKVLPDPVFDIIHKHDPRTVFRNFDRKTAMGVVHPRSASTQYAIYEQFSRSKGRNIVEEADIVLFAGTPFIWAQKTRVAPAYSGNAEWAGPIWRRLFSRWTDKPVLNLAAGTSIATANDLPRVLATRKLTGFLTQAYRRAAWTTSRDRLGVKVARALGFEVPMLPCTSLWAAQGAGIAPGPEDYIAVNLMRHAVHRKRGTHTESAHWKQMARILVRELRAHGDILIIAHDEDELAVAEQWFPEHERFYPETNDRMPAFAERPDDAPGNLLTGQAIELIADWLRGEWYEPPAEPAETPAEDAEQVAGH